MEFLLTFCHHISSFVPLLLLICLNDDGHITEPLSSCPFQVSVLYNFPLDCLHVFIRSDCEVIRSHSRWCLESVPVSVSDQMINVLFVTVSYAINELFIINAHTHSDRQGQRACCQCRSVRGKFHRQTFIRASSCLCTLCESVLVEAYCLTPNPN